LSTKKKGKPMPGASPLKVHITRVYGLIGNLAYQQLAAQSEKYAVYGSE
jgi:hypothetical protein